MLERFRVGIISSVHGIKGEVKVYPTTDEPEKFRNLKEVYIVNESSLKNTEEIRKKIESVKFFKNMVILKMQDIDTPEEARKYIKYDLYIDRKDAIPLEEGENYIGDLIGLNVITDTGEHLGVVYEVFPTGANHVLEVKHKEKHILIPYIKDCILEVNIEEEKILVHLLDGLLDL